ncbi:unnamed protein product [Rangifer tarandus platyrhynchus]|uniref:Uncharacterized protein n=1 Tax=Rangifer tarandus platyrhynchus TaxID=3082113 RepID=A0ABN8Z3E3_RANTA|nr:unnamed protein product [Rangifer tarandus platyrhynchus]
MTVALMKDSLTRALWMEEGSALDVFRLALQLCSPDREAWAASLHLCLLASSGFHLWAAPGKESRVGDRSKRRKELGGGCMGQSLPCALQD